MVDHNLLPSARSQERKVDMSCFLEYCPGQPHFFVDKGMLATEA